MSALWLTHLDLPPFGIQRRQLVGGRDGGVKVRVITAEITITTSAGHATGAYRLATTLTDARAWPAATLIALYHQRWEIEICQPQCTHMCGLAA